ncbi:hypothetical protein VNO80_07283 [Phaseolus coccineus]|uniref:Uncharacterized protein n=1 Tax=Phaseolus coccineus TaxID=3886 RepID=A0AAN9RPL4_PHACN
MKVFEQIEFGRKTCYAPTSTKVCHKLYIGLVVLVKGWEGISIQESSYYRSVRVDGTCPNDRHTNRGEMGHSPKAPKTSSGGRLLKRYRDLHFSNKSPLMGSLDVIGGYSGSRLGFFRENVPSGMIGLPNEDVRNHPPCRMSIGNDNTISFLLNDDDEFILAFTLMFRLESMSHSW